MITFPEIRLGELIEVHYGKSLKASDRIETGEYPVYGSNGRVGFHTEALLRKPTIIVGRKGSVGEITYAPLGGWTIDTAFYTIIKDPNLNLRYLFYALKRARLEKHTITTSIPGINRDDIYATKIPLPPLPVQRRIAAVLDKADALRRKRRRALDKLDELLQAVFLDMFGDPVTNPKEWGRIALNKVCDQIIDCPHSTPQWQDEGVICLRTPNLGKGVWDWTDTRYVSEEDYNGRTKRSEIDPGDIILSREGTVGIAAIVEKGMKICMGQRLVQVRPHSENLTSEYLLYLLLRELDPERIEMVMYGSTSKHLNVSQLRALDIPTPPLELQQRFSAQVASIKKLKDRMNEGNQMAERYFNALMQKAFKGELHFASESVAKMEQEAENAASQLTLFG